MQTSFYLFLIPLCIVCIYIFVKYFLHRKDIKDENLLSDFHNFDDAKELVFKFLDEARRIFDKNFKILLHRVLHVFVIVLGFVSDVTDFLYAKARDFFLKTATKERDVISTFWHHLKEYKKEKEEGK